MEVAIHQDIVRSLRRQASFFRVLACLLGVAVIAQAVAVVVLGKGSERIIVVPPEVNQQFWLEENQVSQRYFLEWGHYVAGLILNVTPASIDYQTETLLRYVAVANRAAFARRLQLVSEHLHAEKLSTFFSVAEVFVQPEHSRIAFVGSLASYIDGQRIDEKTAAYMASFQVRNGSLLLLEFIETNPAAVFTPLTNA